MEFLASRIDGKASLLTEPPCPHGGQAVLRAARFRNLSSLGTKRQINNPAHREVRPPDNPARLVASRH
jgi:hypothetical protein